MGQEYKEVGLTMAKMSKNRKCQIPEGKTNLNFGRAQVLFFFIFSVIKLA